MPLRGTGEVRGSESVGCAALHTRLFKGDRYAVGTLASVVSHTNGDLWVPCLLGERSETASMFLPEYRQIISTASVGHGTYFTLITQNKNRYL